MKILVTGATGFVATNLLPMLLAAGHKVAGLDNFSSSVFDKDLHNGYHSFYEADICEDNYLDKIFELELPELVFHFAGMVSIYDCNNNPQKAINNNILGSANVFNTALKYNCKRVIFAETSAVYEGNALPFDGFSEDQSRPNTIYAVTKNSVAILAKALSDTKGLQYTALRYFNITGPCQDINRTVPPLFAGVALRLLAGKNPIIFGDGNRSRDFIHVDDINNFHINCINNNRTINQTYNLGTGIPTSLFDICNLIHKKLDIKTELKYDIDDEINGEAFEIFANINKAKILGWNPDFNIDKQIDDTVNYIKKLIECNKINPVGYMENLNLKDVKI